MQASAQGGDGFSAGVFTGIEARCCTSAATPASPPSLRPQLRLGRARANSDRQMKARTPWLQLDVVVSAPCLRHNFYPTVAPNGPGSSPGPRSAVAPDPGRRAKNAAKSAENIACKPPYASGAATTGQSGAVQWPRFGGRSAGIRNGAKSMARVIFLPHWTNIIHR